MDVATLGVAVAVAKALPDTAVGRAEQAAVRAETAAEDAESRAFSVTVTDHTLTFTK